MRSVVASYQFQVPPTTEKQPKLWVAPFRVSGPQAACSRHLVGPAILLVFSLNISQVFLNVVPLGFQEVRLLLKILRRESEVGGIVLLC